LATVEVRWKARVPPVKLKPVFSLEIEERRLLTGFHRCRHQ